MNTVRGFIKGIALLCMSAMLLSFVIPASGLANESDKFNLELTAGCYEMLLTWDKVSGAKYYWPQQVFEDGSIYPLIDFASEDLSFHQTKLEANKDYCYFIKATDENGAEVARSERICAKTVCPDPNCKYLLEYMVGQKEYMIDGKKAAASMDSPPVIVNNRTMLSAKYVIDNIKYATIEWNPKDKSVTIKMKQKPLYEKDVVGRSDKIIIYTISKNTVSVDGKDELIDKTNPSVTPMIINGRTMIPFRNLGERLSATVDYIPATKTIKLTFDCAYRKSTAGDTEVKPIYTTYCGCLYPILALSNVSGNDVTVYLNKNCNSNDKLNNLIIDATLVDEALHLAIYQWLQQYVYIDQPKPCVEIDVTPTGRIIRWKAKPNAEPCCCRWLCGCITSVNHDLGDEDRYRITFDQGCDGNPANDATYYINGALADGNQHQNITQWKQKFFDNNHLTCVDLCVDANNAVLEWKAQPQRTPCCEQPSTKICGCVFELGQSSDHPGKFKVLFNKDCNGGTYDTVYYVDMTLPDTNLGITIMQWKQNYYSAGKKCMDIWVDGNDNITQWSAQPNKQPCCPTICIETGKGTIVNCIQTANGIQVTFQPCAAGSGTMQFSIPLNLADTANTYSNIYDYFKQSGGKTCVNICYNPITHVVDWWSILPDNPCCGQTCQWTDCMTVQSVMPGANNIVTITAKNCTTGQIMQLTGNFNLVANNANDVHWGGSPSLVKYEVGNCAKYCIRSNNAAPPTYTIHEWIAISPEDPNCCGSIPECRDCPNNIVKNWGFTEGLVPGAMPTGQVSGWSPAYGSPDVGNDGGCCDPGRINMWGNKVVGEAIQQSVTFVAGRKYKISFYGRRQPDWETQDNAGDPPKFAFMASNSQQSSPTDTTGVFIGTSDPVTTAGCTLLELAEWTAPSNYNTLTVSVTNDISINDGEKVSKGLIDRICISEVQTPNCCQNVQVIIPLIEPANVLNYGLVNATACATAGTKVKFSRMEIKNNCDYPICLTFYPYPPTNGVTDLFIAKDYTDYQNGVAITQPVIVPAMSSLKYLYGHFTVPQNFNGNYNDRTVFVIGQVDCSTGQQLCGIKVGVKTCESCCDIIARTKPEVKLRPLELCPDETTTVDYWELFNNCPAGSQPITIQSITPVSSGISFIQPSTPFVITSEARKSLSIKLVMSTDCTTGNAVQFRFIVKTSCGDKEFSIPAKCKQCSTDCCDWLMDEYVVPKQMCYNEEYKFMAKIANKCSKAMKFTITPVQNTTINGSPSPFTSPVAIPANGTLSFTVVYKMPQCTPPQKIYFTWAIKPENCEAKTITNTTECKSCDQCCQWEFASSESSINMSNAELCAGEKRGSRLRSRTFAKTTR